MAGSGGPVARRAIRTAPEGPSARQALTEPQNGPFCTCGHERPEHRHKRCWVGWDGQPVAYKPSLIACPCTGWEPTP